MGNVSKLISSLAGERLQESDSLSALIPFSMRLPLKEKMKLEAISGFYNQRPTPFASTMLQAALADILDSMDEEAHREFVLYLISTNHYSDEELKEIFEITVDRSKEGNLCTL